jgi:hypothetical protein
MAFLSALKRYDDLPRTTNLGKPGLIIYGEDRSVLASFLLLIDTKA